MNMDMDKSDEPDGDDRQKKVQVFMDAFADVVKTLIAYTSTRIKAGMSTSNRVATSIPTVLADHCTSILAKAASTKEHVPFYSVLVEMVARKMPYVLFHRMQSDREVQTMLSLPSADRERFLSRMSHLGMLNYIGMTREVADDCCLCLDTLGTADGKYGDMRTVRFQCGHAICARDCLSSYSATEARRVLVRKACVAFGLGDSLSLIEGHDSEVLEAAGFMEGYGWDECKEIFNMPLKTDLTFDACVDVLTSEGVPCPVCRAAIADCSVDQDIFSVDDAVTQELADQLFSPAYQASTVMVHHRHTEKLNAEGERLAKLLADTTQCRAEYLRTCALRRVAPVPAIEVGQKRKRPDADGGVNDRTSKKQKIGECNVVDLTLL